MQHAVAQVTTPEDVREGAQAIDRALRPSARRRYRFAAAANGRGTQGSNLEGPAAQRHSRQRFPENPQVLKQRVVSNVPQVLLGVQVHRCLAAAIHHIP